MFKNYNEQVNQFKFPRGYYISLGMTATTYENVRNYFERHLSHLGITFNEKQHITLIYDATPRNDSPILKNYKTKVQFDGFDLFGKQKNVLVVKLRSAKIIGRNALLTKQHGFVSDFAEYNPHFTLSYTFNNIDVNTLPPMNFPLEFELETLENLDKDQDQTIN